MTLAGTLSAIPAPGEGRLAIVIQGTPYSIALSELSYSADSQTISYTAPAGQAGISAFSIKPSTGKFTAKISRAVLPGLVNPLAVEILTPLAEECAVGRMRAKKNLKKPSGRVRDVLSRSARRDNEMLYLDRLLSAAPNQVKESTNHALRTGGCPLRSPVAEPKHIVVRTADRKSKRKDRALTPVRVQLQADGTPDGGTVKLFSLNARGGKNKPAVCRMRDDGNAAAGDAQASDGVYSCQIRVRAKANQSLAFAAEARFAGATYSSPGLAINAVSPMKESGVQSLMAAMNTVHQTWLRKSSEAGNTEEARLKTMLAVRNLRSISNVVYNPEHDRLECVHSSGAAFVEDFGAGYMCPSGQANCTTRCGAKLDGVTQSPASTGRQYDALETTRFRTASPALSTANTPNTMSQKRHVIKNRKVLIWDPGFFEDSTVFETLEGQKSTVRAERIFLTELAGTIACPKLEVTVLKGPNEATIDALREAAGAYGTIVVVSHGIASFYEPYGVRIRSAEYGTEANLWKYAVDLQAGRLIANLHGIEITPGFIGTLGDLSDTLVWGGFCNSNRNVLPTMYDAFLGQAAKSFVGFTRVMGDPFAKYTFQEMFTRLLGNRSTLEEAFGGVLPKLDPDTFYNNPSAARLRRLPDPEHNAARLTFNGMHELAYVGETKLTPGDGAELINDSALNLQVGLPGTEECKNLRYRWTTSGPNGGFKSMAQTDSLLSAVETSEPRATFFPRVNAVGPQHMKVSVVSPAAPGQEEVLLGEAEADIQISRRCVYNKLILFPLPHTEYFEACCDDGIDNDGNGLTDCADKSCGGDSACLTWRQMAVRSASWQYQSGAIGQTAGAFMLFDLDPEDIGSTDALYYCARFDHGGDMPEAGFRFEEDREYVITPYQPGVPSEVKEELLGSQYALADTFGTFYLSPDDVNACGDDPGSCTGMSGYLADLQQKYGHIRFAARKARSQAPCRTENLAPKF